MHPLETSVAETDVVDEVTETASSGSGSGAAREPLQVGSCHLAGMKRELFRRRTGHPEQLDPVANRLLVVARAWYPGSITSSFRGVMSCGLPIVDLRLLP